MLNKILTFCVISFTIITFEAHAQPSLDPIITHLHQQIVDRDVEELRSKLQQYPMHINAVNHDGYSLLQSAVRIGDLELVEALLSHGADPNFQHYVDKHNTALHYSKAASITERLIDHGTDPNIINTEGNRPLFIYVMRTVLNPENIRALLKNGARTDFVSHHEHFTALHLLFAKNMQYQHRMARRQPSEKEKFDKKQKEIAKDLIEYGVDVNALSVYGFTALHYAARVENIGAIELLVSKGAKIDTEDKRQRTPMRYAFNIEALGSVETLLNLGGSFDIPDNRGDSVESIVRRRVEEVRKGVEKDDRYLGLLNIIDQRERSPVCRGSLTET